MMASRRRELDEPDGGLDVGHPPVEPGLQVRLDDDATGGVPVRGAGVHAVLAQSPGTRPDLRVADGQHSTLAGGDELARMEGEGDEVAVAADQFTAIRRSDGARGILDDGDPSWVAQRMYRLDVGRDSGLMDEDDGLRACRDHRSDRVRREVLRVELDISEHGRRADVARRVCSGDERQ